MIRPFATALLAAALAPFLHAAEMEAGGMKFTAAGWKPAEAARPMSAGSLVKEGEAKQEAIFYHFPGGQGGDVEANLQRWAGQFAADPAPKVEREKVKAGDKEIVIATITGTYKGSPTRPEPEPRPDHVMLAAIVPGPQGNVFIRLTAPRAEAEAAKAEFQALAASPHAAE
jgi:hypothetical protein